MPALPRPYGPIRSPAIRKAVTSGKLAPSNLNIRVNIRPANKATEIERKTFIKLPRFPYCETIIFATKPILIPVL